MPSNGFFTYFIQYTMEEYEKVEELTDQLKSYADTNIELVKLEFTERLAMAAPLGVSGLILGQLVILFVIFLSAGLSFYLSELLGHAYLGFVLVAGFYLLLALVYAGTRARYFEAPLRNKIVKSFAIDSALESGTEAKITTYASLLVNTRHMKEEKRKQEEVLKREIREMIYRIDPISVMKNALHELAQDKVVKMDLAKVGLNMGANLLVNQVLGGKLSIKGFMSALLIEKASSLLSSDRLLKLLAKFNQGKKKVKSVEAF